MIQLLLILCSTLLAFNSHDLIGYGLPTIGLGGSHILDGGPLRPSPGLYWQQNATYYHADTFLDDRGKNIFKGKSPDFNVLATSIQFFYQFEEGLIPNAQFGIASSLPIALYSHIGHNQLNIKTSGSGLGDFGLGLFLQFNPIVRNERAIFVHRLEFNVSFPTGKYTGSENTMNPGNNLFFIDPYWAFTLYITPKIATSWRIHYNWSSENKKTHLKPGDAIHFNYAFGCQACPKLWISINGYFLQQLKNDKRNNIEVPDSKERLFSTGFGWLYSMTPKDNLFANAYFEFFGKNREQGMRFTLHYLKHF